MTTPGRPPITALVVRSSASSTSGYRRPDRDVAAHDAPAKPTVSGFWTRISARVVLMLGFAYAASWWADQRFYSHFGIAPQDIGLTPSGGLSDIIGAIVRLGLWVALALVVLGGLPV